MTSIPRQSIRSGLETQSVVWLGSIRPDGTPHVVPIWFLWDGRSILVFSKPDAQKVRNLRANPRVMVAVGDPNVDFDVELVEAIAKVAPFPSRPALPDAFATKYARMAAQAGLTMERFASVYAQPIWIRPTRWLGWGGQGWSDVEGAATSP
jgi:PPOX class probable F420-dependent enzyme